VPAMGGIGLKKPPLYRLSDFIRLRLILRGLYRMQVLGAERVPRSGGVILVANHESMIDPWLLGVVTPRPIRYMAKAELWRLPVVRWIMDAYGTFPVDRGSGDRGAVGRGAELLTEGEVLGLFPQGTCLPFRRRPWMRGAARLALTTGAPIVPIAIVGSERALRPGRFKIGLPRIRVLVGEPIEVKPAKPSIAAAREVTALVEQRVEELRAPYGPPAHAWYPEEGP
jgi:1-acyl-sn-glycerol-3-phosphate acyltransferase